MANYDPQRTRPPQGADPGPAPVDELLGGPPAAPPEAAGAVEADPHVHGPDCGHGQGLGVRPIAAAVAAAAAAVLLVVRRRRRSRRSSAST